MEIKVATIEDLSSIGEFSRQQLKASGVTDAELMMKSWNEPWRDESLEHYLNTGWCFVARDGDELKGYVLCQPLLFFQSWTQSLWVEYLAADSDKLKNELLDVAWRWAKSKHLQRVKQEQT